MTHVLIVNRSSRQPRLALSSSPCLNGRFDTLSRFRNIDPTLIHGGCVRSGRYQLARVARQVIDSALQKSALFDLGLDLTWVPKRVSDTEYILGVSNNYLHELPLSIKANSPQLGDVTQVVELPLDQSEKGAEGYLPHGFENASLGKSTASTIAGVDMRVFRVTTALIQQPSALAAPPSVSGSGSGSQPMRVLLRLSARIGSIRTEIERRPSFFNYFAGVVVDSEYFSSRSERALAIENRWLQLQHVDVVCDFTRSTDLFPGLRLIDDISAYFNESMEIIEDVLDKLPLLRSQHAMLTLHGGAELPPAVGPCSGASGREQGTNWTACFRHTLQRLTARARTTNTTLHLRHSHRNDNAIAGSLQSQAVFAASVDSSHHFKIAPSTGMPGAGGAQAATLFTQGAADILLLSAPWGGRGTSAPLVELPMAQRAKVAVAVRAAEAAAAFLVLDAGFTVGNDNDAAGRGAELTDLHLLRSMLSSGGSGALTSMQSALKSDDSVRSVPHSSGCLAKNNGSDSDCYGGRCLAGRCLCSPMWRGTSCETLSLVPAALDSGLRLINTTTWGGGILQDDTTWHMYAARMVDNCGLKSCKHFF